LSTLLTRQSNISIKKDSSQDLTVDWEPRPSSQYTQDMLTTTTNASFRYWIRASCGEGHDKHDNKENGKDGASRCLRGRWMVRITQVSGSPMGNSVV